MKMKKVNDKEAGSAPVSNSTPASTYTYPLKRVMDVIGAVVGLILLSPILLVVALLILVTMGRPVFFIQERPGLYGKPFRIIKFRTMRQGPGSDSERLTKLGRLLRRLSIDELPELWNVLKGDMSLVGPRPLLMKYLERYTPEQARRHLAKPGITGLAQVQGRRRIPFSKRIELDVLYVDNLSFWLDLKIIILSVYAVLFTRGDEPGQRIEDVDDLGLSGHSRRTQGINHKEV